MQIEIRPSAARGSVKAPPSKSMAHRLLICAGLAAGESRISGIAPSQDVLATLDCLGAIGADCRYEGDTVTVRGIDAAHMQINGALVCRECGSTLRFFIPIALLCGSEVTLTGSERLLQRPLGVYEELCRASGLRFERGADSVTVCGPFTPGSYTVAGDVSSQFISGLLFALPLLQGDSEICITGRIESRAYIDLTVDALAQFGVCVAWKDECTLTVRGTQRYRPLRAEVEGDYSNAAFLDALNLMGGDVTVTGLREESLQADRVYKRAFSMLAQGSAAMDLSSCPDLGPILIALAAHFHGATFTGTARLQIKESDRGRAMERELSKMGARITVSENEIVVHPSRLHEPSGTLCSHNDHRIVMALSVLLTCYGGVIEGAEAVEKSMPEFFETLKRLGVNTKEHDTE